MTTLRVRRSAVGLTAALLLSACATGGTDTTSSQPAAAVGAVGAASTSLDDQVGRHRLGPAAQADRARQRTVDRQALPTLPALPGSSPKTSPSPPAAPARVSKLLVVVLENHSTSQVRAQMPYLRALGSRYGVTTDYRAVTHPSLPNYLAMVGGSTFGVTDDAAPSRHPIRGSSVFDLALARGHTAKTYADAMPGACGQSSTSTYAVKHNPWVYFADATPRASCRRFDVPLGTTSSGALHDDVAAGRLPDVGLLVPDICHDGHDCSLATADGWLKSWMQPILAGPDYRAGRLAVVVTFDEDDHRDGNRVLTTVVAPTLHGRTVTTALTHYSLARALAEVAGATPPGQAASATSLRTAFGL